MGEAPERVSRGRSPRAWVKRAKPPSVGRESEAPERKAEPPSVGRESEALEREYIQMSIH
jgi:hypothetical protein